MTRRMPMRLICLILFSANIISPQMRSQQSRPTRKSVPEIVKTSNGAVVLIVMANDSPIATGTGFVVSQWHEFGDRDVNVAIVTNYHVIANGKFGAVRLPDHTTIWKAAFSGKSSSDTSAGHVSKVTSSRRQSARTLAAR